MWIGRPSVQSSNERKLGHGCRFRGDHQRLVVPAHQVLQRTGRGYSKRRPNNQTYSPNSQLRTFGHGDPNLNRVLLLTGKHNQA